LVSTAFAPSRPTTRLLFGLEEATGGFLVVLVLSAARLADIKLTVAF